MDRDTSDFWGVILLVFGMIGLIFCAGYWNGHDQGVKDHATGSYVVVHLPDGTDRVCKVVEKEHPATETVKENK